MKKDKPLVSIVTSSYNQGRFIEDTLLSVKNQDYPNIEHIVVDGESIDNTLEILRKYENEYNLRFISESDKGQADAVNKGFKMANGEIIGWLNSDDAYFDTSVISNVVRAFYKYLDADLIYGDVIIISKNNLIMKVLCVKKFDYKYLQKTCYIYQPAVFFRRKIIDKYELDTRLNYAMDYEFWLRVGKEHKFQYINRMLAVDRRHEHRKTISGRDKMIKESILVSKEYGKYHNRDLLNRIFNFNSFSEGLWIMKGLIKLQSLYFKKNFAFDVRLDNRLSSGLRQVLYPILWKFHPLIQDFNFIRRIEWRIISSWLDPKMGEKICDISCGSGEISIKIARKGCKVYGVDINKFAINRAKMWDKHRKCEFQVGNAEKLPYPSFFFDKLVCNSSLEHFHKYENSLKEMNRVLKLDGVMVLTVDSFSYKGISEGIKELHKKEHHVENYFNDLQLKNKIERLGFIMEKKKYYINSKISSYFFDLGVRSGFGYLFYLIFPLSYPLSILSDKLFGRKNEGYCLAIKARKTLHI